MDKISLLILGMRKQRQKNKRHCKANPVSNLNKGHSHPHYTEPTKPSKCRCTWPTHSKFEDLIRARSTLIPSPLSRGLQITNFNFQTRVVKGSFYNYSPFTKKHQDNTAALDGIFLVQN